MIRLLLLIGALTLVHEATALSLELLPAWKCPMTKCGTGCRLRYDVKGCGCTCPETSCLTKKCDRTQMCIMKPGDCNNTTSCISVPTCIPNPILSIIKKILPTVRDCLLNPTTRWVYDKTSDACQSIETRGCIPKPDTYETEQECKDKNGLEKDPVMCIALACSDDCYSYRSSPDQCPRCICPNPCQTMKCSSGYECRLKEVTCIRAPCDPAPECVATCPEQPPCGLRCRYGLKQDKNGCQVCECVETPRS